MLGIAGIALAIFACYLWLVKKDNDNFLMFGIANVLFGIEGLLAASFGWSVFQFIIAGVMFYLWKQNSED